MVTLERVEVLRMALDRHEDDDKALQLAAQMFQLLEGGTDGPRLADGVNLEDLDIGPGQIQPVEPEQTDTPREPDARGDEAAASAEPATSETDEEPPSPRATSTAPAKLKRAERRKLIGDRVRAGATNAELADEFDVSEWTIHQDIKALGLTGMRRRGGGLNRSAPAPAEPEYDQDADQAAIEAHIQENGVRRFEPGTIDSLIIQAFEAMGCKALRWGHEYSGGADFQVDGKVVKRRDAIRSVNEYRLSIGQEPISLIEEGAGGR